MSTRFSRREIRAPVVIVNQNCASDGCGCGGCSWLIVLFTVFALIAGSCGVT